MNSISSIHRIRRAVLLTVVLSGSSSVFAQATQVEVLRGAIGAPGTETTVFDYRSDGTFVSTGFVRDVGNTTGCAQFLPVSGAGTRFIWHPCRGSVRFGRVPTAQTNWDDANMDDFTFAGGNQVIASGYGAFSYGDQVTVSSTVGVGFGSAVTVSGTAGFSAGASNVCSGFACTAIGYTTRSAGQGSVALGYRTEAAADYSVALGYRATTCQSGNIAASSCVTPHTGAFVWADESSTNYTNAQFDNEFRIRANGGIRLRTSAAANAAAGVNANTGCDLPTGSGTWSCASSRTIKTAFEAIDSVRWLEQIRRLPMSTWTYIGDTAQSRHLGPVAEDFFEAFALGEGPNSIGAQDLASLGLVGVQALAAQDDAQSEQIRALQNENASLQRALDESTDGQRTLLARLAELEARLTRMESQRED